MNNKTETAGTINYNTPVLKFKEIYAANTDILRDLVIYNDYTVNTSRTKLRKLHFVTFSLEPRFQIWVITLIMLNI